MRCLNISITGQPHDRCDHSNCKRNNQYDLAKAFDVLNQDSLLHTLNNFGSRGVVNTWFENYLSNRSQYVDIENFSSSRKHIARGVSPKDQSWVPYFF